MNKNAIGEKGYHYLSYKNGMTLDEYIDHLKTIRDVYKAGEFLVVLPEGDDSEWFVVSKNNYIIDEICIDSGEGVSKYLDEEKKHLFDTKYCNEKCKHKKIIKLYKST